MTFARTHRVNRPFCRAVQMMMISLYELVVCLCLYVTRFISQNDISALVTALPPVRINCGASRLCARVLQVWPKINWSAQYHGAPRQCEIARDLHASASQSFVQIKLYNIAPGEWVSVASCVDDWNYIPRIRIQKKRKKHKWKETDRL